MERIGCPGGMSRACGMSPEVVKAPYLASLGLYRAWMAERLSGYDDAAAWERVASAMPRAGRRGMARALVAGAHGQQPLVLSVPVAGGGSVLKRGRPEDWRLSMHGRWPAVHAGALEAAYSATPFFPHLRDELMSALRGAAEGDPFLGLTTRLHHVMMGLLGVEGLLPSLREMSETDPERLRRIAEEKNDGLHTDLTFLDVICRRGREAVFSLLPYQAFP